MDQADDNSLTALLTKKSQVRFCEIVNTCTERRAEKRIQRTAWILSHVLRKRCVNMWTVCAQPDGSMSSLLQSTGSSPYVHVHLVGPLAATLHCVRNFTLVLGVATRGLIQGGKTGWRGPTGPPRGTLAYTQTNTFKIYVILDVLDAYTNLKNEDTPKSATKQRPTEKKDH